MPSLKRREFIGQVLRAAAWATTGGVTSAVGSRPLVREVGVTTGSFSKHYQKSGAGPRKTLLELPKVMRGELDLRVIDLMTATVPSWDPAYLSQLRRVVEQEGCLLTNLKMNQPGLDLGSDDEAKRRHAIEEYKRSMTAAAFLGARWVRPISGAGKAKTYDRLAASYRELIDHGGPLGVTLLIENVGWIKSDPHAIPEIIRTVGQGLQAQPDIGNWTDDVRYLGLAKAFPLAVSCDFKVFTLEADGSHPRYDLERCFRVGWDAGFRGPWCLEHFHDNFETLLTNLRWLRDRLRSWMVAAEAER